MLRLSEDPSDWPDAQMAGAGSESAVVHSGVRLAGRYLVGKAIGRGGMATVYHGHDQLLDRDVAVKILGSVAADATGSRQEFLREARAAAALSHPNIVGMYDAGVHGSRVRYIVMEYVPGGSLSDIIQAEAPLLPSRVVQIVTQLADALDYGHRHGIIHCDVKPQNVLIDESGRPKLVDFGISRSIAATGALTDTISGTAGYIAPEQLLGESVDGRVDVYALGCVAYEMFCGELPFDASNLAALATQRLVRAPIPLASRNPALPPALAESVMRAIEREPDRRYATAHDFGRALGAGLTSPGNGRARRQYASTDSVSGLRQGTTVVERPPRDRVAASSGPRLFWPLTLVSMGVLLLAGVLVALHFPSVAGRPSGPPVVVPKVTGETLLDAATQVQHAGLKISVRNQPTSGPNACNGQVLSQDPDAPTQVSKGSTVTLVVTINDQC